MINQHVATRGARVVDHFDATDLGAPFRVILKRSVKATFDPDTGDMVDYTIPDLDGLLRTVVLSRILHVCKLAGEEVKFLRKALGIKQKDVARSIEVTPEHLSRCEKGDLVLSAGSEKLLRVFLYKTAIKHHNMKECEAKRKLEDGLDRLFDILSPSPVRNADDELAFCFHWSDLTAANDQEGDPEGDPAWEDAA